MATKNWIQKATKNKGGLRKALGTPEGKTIPVAKLKEASKKPGKLGKQARLALTLRNMRKKGK